MNQKQTILNLLEFLKRIDLKGSEAVALVVGQQYLEGRLAELNAPSEQEGKKKARANGKAKKKEEAKTE